jgi:hypothetical protein
MAAEEEAEVGSFFEYLYGLETGWVYVATKDPDPQHQKPFEQAFFEWPTQRGQLVEFVLQKRASREVYMGPAIYHEPKTDPPAIDHIKGAQVAWVEFDGNAPESAGSLPEPTLKLRSSLEGHEHWYWKLDQILPPEDVQKINRGLMYALGSDTSGWDAAQILRPPMTLNHKRERETAVLLVVPDVALDPRLFHGLPEPPPPVDEPVPDSIPDIVEVVAKYKWPTNAVELFRSTPKGPVRGKSGTRSEALMALGYYCAEMNMTKEDMVSVLLNADQRWGKFYGRSDRMRRLMEIVTIARQKYPYRPNAEDAREGKLEAYGFMDLLKVEVELEWAWEGLMHTTGYFLLVGPSAVGKTQLSLDVGMSMATGSRALDRPVRTARTGFFSLEMDLVELKEFLTKMQTLCTDEEREMLNERLKLFPLGESLALNQQGERELVEQAISDYKLDGIFIDSMSSATEDNLTDEAAKNLVNWIDRLRHRHGVFTWWIHHQRKASGDNKKPKKLDDVYGSRHITRTASSVMLMWDTNDANIKEFSALKVRLAAKPDATNIKRGPNLRYTRLVSGIAPEPGEPEEDSVVDKEKGQQAPPPPQAAGGNFDI